MNDSVFAALFCLFWLFAGMSFIAYAVSPMTYARWLSLFTAFGERHREGTDFRWANKPVHPFSKTLLILAGLFCVSVPVGLVIAALGSFSNPGATDAVNVTRGLPWQITAPLLILILVGITLVVVPARVLRWFNYPSGGPSPRTSELRVVRLFGVLFLTVCLLALYNSL
jgi:hypothetical protein